MTPIKRRSGIEAGILGVKVKYESEWADQECTIKIQSPAHGEKFNESDRSRYRPIYGIITGFTKERIIKQGLKVKISIITDIEYPQGIAHVDEGGRWVLKSAHFGGNLHIVQAELIDKDEKSLGLIDRVDVVVEKN